MTSCLVGICVSHSAYVMRSACSDIFSAVVGIQRKVFTVVINILIWDKHARPIELAFLRLGLLAVALYGQDQMRQIAVQHNIAPTLNTVVSEPEIKHCHAMCGVFDHTFIDSTCLVKSFWADA